MFANLPYVDTCIFILLIYRISAGELASRNNELILSISNLIGNMSSRSDLESLSQSLTNQHEMDIKAVKEWAAPLQFVTTIQKSQQDFSNRINNIEG